MKIKLNSTVKVQGLWHRPGDEVSVAEELGNELIAKGCGVLVPKSQAEIEAEEAVAKAAEEAATALAEKEEAERKAAEAKAKKEAAEKAKADPKE